MPEHAEAAEFVAACAADKELWCTAWLTLMSLMRMATHPALFSKPLSHEEAARNVDSLLVLPQLRVIDERPDFWARYREVAQEAPVRDNLCPTRTWWPCFGNMASRRSTSATATSASSAG